jgi:hypothetical protein
LTEEKSQTPPAKSQRKTYGENGAKGIPPDQLILGAERRQAFAYESLGLELPGNQKVVFIGMWQEAVQALPEA